MTVERLFLSRDNVGCGLVLAYLDWNAVIDDEITGENGNSILVFSAHSPMAVAELLDNFGFQDQQVPLLQVGDQIITDPKKIIAHLKHNGMADMRGIDA